MSAADRLPCGCTGPICGRPREHSHVDDVDAHVSQLVESIVRALEGNEAGEEAPSGHHPLPQESAAATASSPPQKKSSTPLGSPESGATGSTIYISEVWNEGMGEGMDDVARDDDDDGGGGGGSVASKEGKKDYKHPEHDIPQETLTVLEADLAEHGVYCTLLRNPPPPRGQPGAFLGQGVFGQVHLGLRRPDERFEATFPQLAMAVKITPIKHLDRKTVLDEVAILKAAGTNLHLVSIYLKLVRGYVSTRPEYAADDDLQVSVIVMELISGGTLADFIGEVMEARVRPNPASKVTTRLPRPIPEPLGRGWIASLIDGLHYLHTEVAIAHRDLHTGNIMITGDGGLKLVDLGLAKKFEAGTFSERMSTQLDKDKLIMAVHKIFGTRALSEGLGGPPAANSVAGFLVAVDHLVDPTGERPTAALNELHTRSAWLAEDKIVRWFSSHARPIPSKSS